VRRARIVPWIIVGVVLLGGATWRATIDEHLDLHNVSVRTGPNAGPLAPAVDTTAGHVLAVMTSATDKAGHPIGNGAVALLDTSTNAILDRVAVGGSGNAVAVDDALHRAFVATTLLPPFVPAPVGTTLRVLDTRSGRLLRTIRVGNAPIAVAVDGRTGHVFVATRGLTRAGIPTPGRVLTLDARTGTVTHVATVGISPRTIAVATTTRRIFVVNQDSDNVSMLDARTGRLLHTTPLGHAPCDAGDDSPCTAAVDARTGRVFVASYTANTAGSGMGTISMLDARTGVILRTIPVHGRPYAAAVHGRAGHAFITNLGDATLVDGAVLMLDARTGRVLRTIPVGGAPGAITADERSGRAIVLGTNGGARAILNHLSLDRSFANDTLSVLDTRSGAIVRTVKVGGDLRAVAIDARTGHAFIANYGDGAVSMLDVAR